MDVQAIRERMINGFKPKTKDIATPYLEELDGELMLRGITGKEALDLAEAATEQITAKDGTVTNKVNGRKLASLRVQACLLSRSTREPIYSVVDVLGEKGDGNGALLEMDDAVFQKLISDIYSFIGAKDAPADVKKSSETTPNESNGSSSPPASEEPLTNSLEPSTVQS